LKNRILDGPRLIGLSFLSRLEANNILLKGSSQVKKETERILQLDLETNTDNGHD